MNDIVKYNNDMNLLKFKGFSKTDMNLLMVLCSKMKDKDIERITFSFQELKDLSNYTSTDNKDFILDLKRMVKRLIKVNSEIITGGKIYYFVLFPTFLIDAENKILTVAVNKDFVFLLNELKVFTKFELREFVELDSKYAKNLYRLLKQYRTTGVLRITDIDDFREKMDSPKSYSKKRFSDNVLKVAMNELQEKEIFKDLECESVKAPKRGAPVIGYIFTFTPEKANKKEIEASQTKKETKDKTKQNNHCAAKNETPEISTLDDIMELIDSYHLDMGIKSTLACSRKAEELNRSLDYVKDVLEIVKGQSCDNVAAKLMSLLMNGYDKPKKRVTTKFSNFTERDYDFDELEKQLLKM